MVCSRYPQEYLYYERALKRKCFKKLKNNVWENKTKWVLTKKADSHLRSKLLHKCFNFWMIYFNESLRKKINKRLAEDYYTEKLKCRGILAFKRNVTRSWILTKIYAKKFEWNLRQKCWHRWKHYTQKRVKVKEIKKLADNLREEKLKFKFLHLWSFRLNEKRFLQSAYKKVGTQYESKLLKKYFALWKVFTKRQVCKTNIKTLARVCHEDKLKEKIFNGWRRYAFQKKRYKYQMKIIKIYYENYLIGNYLGRWKTFYHRVKLERKVFKYNIAVNYCRKKLLEKCFKVLWIFREMNKTRKEKIKTFREIYEKIYLNFYLNLWVKQRTNKVVCDQLEFKAKEWREDYLRDLFLTKLIEKHRERLEEEEEMAKVVKYFDSIVTHRAFRGWMKVTAEKIKKKVQLENAFKHYFERLLKKIFDKWKNYRLKRLKKKMAVEYHNGVLLTKTMNLWKDYVSEQIINEEKANHFVKKLKSRLLKKVFISWKNEKDSFGLKLKMARDSHEKNILSRALRTWKKNSERKFMYRTKLNRNRLILNDIIVKNNILRWYEMHSVKQNIKEILKEFSHKRDERLLRRCFVIWYRFVEKMKGVQEIASSYPRIWSRILVEEYLINMSEAVKKKKIQSRKYELAKKAEEKMMKRRYFRNWLTFLCWKREKILKCKSEERKRLPKNPILSFIPSENFSRRKPMIPDYLKTNFNVDHKDSINEETYRILQPVNKKLPLIDEKGVSF